MLLYAIHNRLVLIIRHPINKGICIWQLEAKTKPVIEYVMIMRVGALHCAPMSIVKAGSTTLNFEPSSKREKMMRSFYSEKTAEYTVVPAFGNILETLGHVAPMFFLRTREGNKISEMIHGKDEVRVVAFFARRPKVNPSSLGVLQAKINTSLFDFAKRAYTQRIPVFCGLPLTQNVFQLRNAACLWFHIDPNYAGDEPVFNIREHEFEPLTFHYDDLHPLSKGDVLDIVKSCSPKISWQNAISAMTELYRKQREDSDYYPWWLRNWQYKPMYFVIKET